MNSEQEGEVSEHVESKARRLLNESRVTKLDAESGNFTDVFQVTGDSDTYSVLFHKETGVFECGCMYTGNGGPRCSHAEAVKIIVDAFTE